LLKPDSVTRRRAAPVVYQKTNREIIPAAFELLGPLLLRGIAFNLTDC
jgi:hypothetical protein